MRSATVARVGASPVAHVAHARPSQLAKTRLDTVLAVAHLLRVISPASSRSTWRSASILSANAIASRGGRSPTDCSSSTARNSRPSNVAARSVDAGRRDPPAPARNESPRPRPSAWARHCRQLELSPVRPRLLQVDACDKNLVLPVFELQASQLSALGLATKFCVKGSAALVTSRAARRKRLRNAAGTPAISK